MKGGLAVAGGEGTQSRGSSPAVSNGSSPRRRRRWRAAIGGAGVWASLLPPAACRDGQRNKQKQAGWCEGPDHTGAQCSSRRDATPSACRPSLAAPRDPRRRALPCCCPASRAAAFNFDDDGQPDRLPPSTALVAPLPATYAPHVAAAIDAVRLASILTARVQAQLKSGDAVSKEDASPVTVADYGAQSPGRLVRRPSRRPHHPPRRGGGCRRPQGGGWGRDGGQDHGPRQRGARLLLPVHPALTPATVLDLIDTGASPGGSDGMHWVLDPIDGTRGFVGGRQYAICLGLLDGGLLAAGILGCPNLPTTPLTAADGGRVVDDASFGERDGVLFYASVGGGAWCAPLAGQTRPRRPHPHPRDARGCGRLPRCASWSRLSRRTLILEWLARASALGVTAPPSALTLKPSMVRWRAGCCHQHEVPQARVP